MMKKLFNVVTGLAISFSMNAQTGSTSYGDGTGFGIGEDYNSAFGSNVLSSNTTGRFNSGFGNAVLKDNTSADDNSGFGYRSLYLNITGSDNSAYGFKSLFNNTSGNKNSAFGHESLYFNTTGYYNTASGDGSLYSNTIGTRNTASGQASLSTNTTGSYNTAFGYNAQASANNATNQTIIGYDATGQADNSVVLGNDAVTAVYMGEDSGATVYAAGLNLGGVEITSSATELNFLDGVTTIGDGILASVSENSNTGVRLSTSNATNHGDIGSNAVDLSYSASSSTSYGATGDYSIAMGYGTTASGIRSFAGGLYTVASGGGSFAFHSGTTASGTNSTALGRVTVASDYASLVIGHYNSTGSLATSANSFSTSAPAFVIGNGADASNKSDAFKVMFNGDATVSNDLTVSGDVVISSDARLKSNIVSLGSTLPKLLQIDGKSYEMKGKQKIGVLAQEIQKVFPELVSEDNNENLAVNYQGLVPVLINALKEQDNRISNQQNEINELKTMLKTLIE